MKVSMLVAEILFDNIWCEKISSIIIPTYLNDR